MRYSKEHKQESRERILESARQLFRKGGFEQASIDEIMSGAGLTRGAFYAHFKSKGSLADSVLAIESGLKRELSQAAEEADARQEVFTVVERYLSSANRKSVVEGCPLVTHPNDALRGDGARRRAYAKHVKAVVHEFDRTLGTRPRARPSGDAIRMAVLAIGGALLSGASGGGKFAEAISQACLDGIESGLDAQ